VQWLWRANGASDRNAVAARPAQLSCHRTCDTSVAATHHQDGQRARTSVVDRSITHYTASAYPQVEAVLAAEPLDFLQINYAADDREAEKRLLPLAAERGVAVIVNMPFGGGGLLRGLLARPLPGWAADIGCTSWAQVLLKFVLSHPAVTCAIPGTRRREHLEDNARAGFGSTPDAKFWLDKVPEIGR
jgi:aryl-alcohol dehydrogenase-like predicted oxidoreductase